MSILNSRKNSGSPGEEDWISVSDLMSALMMIFLLLAVFYMMFLDEENKLQKIDKQEYLYETEAWESKLISAEKTIAEQERILLEARNKSAEKDKLLAEAIATSTEKERLLAEAIATSTEKDKLLAEANAASAEKNRLLAEANATGSEKDRLLAEANAASAEKDRLLAEANAASAEKDRLLAEANARNAENDRLLAEANAKNAENERLLAEANAQNAENERLLAEANAQNAENDRLLLEAKAKNAEQDKLLAEANATSAEKDKLLLAASTTSAEKDKLLLEAGTTSTEKDQLLAKATEQLALIKNQNELKVSKFDAVISEAVIYEDVINELRQSLLGEFNPDLKKWNAELRDDLTFRFNEPRTLFSIGDATLKPRFKRILDDFFPRYLKVITSDKFRKDITEVRIEGHTSSVWGDLDPNGQQAYFNNMELSQNRSKNTLFYVTQLPEAERHAEWLKSRLTANGLSSSKLVDKNGYFLNDPRSNGIENERNSQRAEFRVKIDAESKITKILDSGKIE
jgi:outer membrane protein OmpA-like peptidoglycan-associated protein